MIMLDMIVNCEWKTTCVNLQKISFFAPCIVIMRASMRSADVTTNLRKTVLGIRLYNDCLRDGGRIERGVLEKRLKNLQTEGHFTECDVDTFAKLCSLREDAPLEQTNSCLDHLEEEIEDVDDKYNLCVLCSSVERDGEGIVPLSPCGHEVHRECMKDFVRSWGKARCPTCANPIDDPTLQTDALLTEAERQERSMMRVNVSRDVMFPTGVTGQELERESLERSRVGHLRRMLEILRNEELTPMERVEQFLDECQKKFRLGFPFTISGLRSLPEAREVLQAYDDVAGQLDEEDAEEKLYLEQVIDKKRYIRQLIATLPREENKWETLEYILEQFENDEWLQTHIQDAITDTDRQIIIDAIENYNDTDEMYNELEPYFTLRRLRRRVAPRLVRTSAQDREFEALAQHLRSEEARLTSEGTGFTEVSQFLRRLQTQAEADEDYTILEDDLSTLRGYSRSMRMGDLITAAHVLYETNNEELRRELKGTMNRSIQTYRRAISSDLVEMDPEDVKSLISCVITLIVPLMIRVDEYDFEPLVENMMSFIENVSYVIEIKRNRELAKAIEDGVKQAIRFLVMEGNPTAVTKASLASSDSHIGEFLMEVAEDWLEGDAYYAVQTYVSDSFGDEE